MEYIKLSEACTINMGQSPDSSTYNEDGKGIPFYQGKADFGEKYPKVRIWCFEPTKIAQANDILISVRAPIGALNYADTECCIGRGLAAIKPIKDRFTKEYIYYLLKSKHEELNKQGTGSTFKAISRKVLENVELPNISIHDQIEIVDRLDKIVTIIDMKKLQIKLLDNLIKSRFVELFVDKNFPEITIGELVASKVSSVKKVFLPTDTIKYIDISSIDNIRNIMTGFTEYVLEDAPSRAQQHIRKGDIVVSTVRPNLKNVAITGYDYDNLVASSGFCVLRAEKCLPSYLMAVICSDDFTDAMTKVVTGANYPAIKDSDVKNYVVPNPPIELQEKFAAFVEQTDKLKFYKSPICRERRW